MKDSSVEYLSFGRGMGDIYLEEKVKELEDRVDTLEMEVKFLHCLEDCGVAHWEGYDRAVELYEKS